MTKLVISQLTAFTWRLNSTYITKLKQGGFSFTACCLIMISLQQHKQRTISPRVQAKVVQKVVGWTIHYPIDKREHN